MSQVANKYYTVEEYLALEEKAVDKSEYYDGKISLRDLSFYNHVRITCNTLFELHASLRSTKFAVFDSNLRLLVQAHEYYTYADLMVACEPFEFARDRDDTISNPVMLAEVLSPSTRNYDRGDKFRFYRSIESLQIYLLIEQDEIYVEYHQKLSNDTWQLKTYNKPDQVIELAAIGVSLTVERLYEHVKFPASKPKRNKSREKIVPHPKIENNR